MKRKIDILVISDTHLGTFGAQAQQLLEYLETVEPKQLIINGDLIDIWQLMKWYFPESHFGVLKKLLAFVRMGVPTYYVTGNHDDLLRRFTPIELDNFHLVDEVILDIDGKRTWVFHGDRYDKTIKSQFAAMVGGLGYNCLIVVDRQINRWRAKLGLKRIRISKWLKDFTKKAATKVNNFEQEAIDVAIAENFDYLICGHIHKPQIRTIPHEKGMLTYLNSGDWIENLTALEYANKEWRIFNYELKIERNTKKQEHAI